MTIELKIKQDSRLLTKYFELNWKQVQFLKNVIMWYTDIYMAVIAIAVAILGAANFENLFFLLFMVIFFFLMSVLGLLITSRVEKKIKKRNSVGVDIMEIFGIEDCYNKIKDEGFDWMDYLYGFYLIMCVTWISILILDLHFIFCY